MKNVYRMLAMLSYRVACLFRVLFSLFANKPRKNSEAGATVPINLGGKLYHLNAEDKWFWERVHRGGWEWRTFVALDRCLNADSVYLDVGAWLGPTVLFAAQRCRTVYCIEPDPIACERLLFNLRMNDIRNVRLFQGALHPRNEVVHLINSDHFGNSETQIKESGSASVSAVPEVAVLGVELFRFMEWWGIEKIDMIKMDVEGAEFALMPSLMTLTETQKPIIHLSTHAPLFEESERAAKVALVSDLVARYKFCYDKKLRKMDVAQLPEAIYTGKFSELVLADEELF